MRILLLSGASSVHTVRWANAFAAKGQDVHLVSQHRPLDRLDARVVLHRFPHLAGLGYFLNVRRLQRLVRALRPDVVNAHYATGYGTLAHASGAVPLVLNVWGSDVHDFPQGGPLHRAVVRRNLRRADQVVSTSHVMADHTRALCPGLGEIAVIPFGVDMDLFRPDARTEPAVRGLVIGTVKTLAPKYGISTLIDAFALLRPGHPGLRLRIVGTGPQEAELKQRARQAGVADAVDWPGHVAHADVPHELRRMDVFVALSRLDSESFGVAVIEASACGLPVVVSDAGGLPEVVVQGRTGWVVPRGDPAGAAAKLDQLLRMPEMRERMGQAGLDHVRLHYDWPHCVDAMLNVLQRAAHGGASR
jgi:glycosyltransferase involved in cell wall biosynthesis